jgi:GT2 family glycosyltransferase
VTLDSPSFLDEGWILEMESAEGVVLETPGPIVEREPEFVRERILADATRHRLPDEDLMVNHVMPAITCYQKHVKDSIEIVSVEQFGDAPADPAVSIIIPLYKRVDLIEQQLAEFVQDREMSEADLIYVLDSPEQEDELLFLAARLFPIYQVPMRVAILKCNVGFAGANNAGASIARGHLLALMNSDVLPDKPGWLGKLQRFYDSTPNIGALAPKVLYEDGSIQNAGMRFHRSMGTSVWLDAHFYRGLHRDFAPANVPRKVPLVSGCCFMVARSLYESLGGLQGIYVQGDYEDSDFCMRLNELGRDNWYLPEAEVYHPEGLSYPSDIRKSANWYNGWLHTHIWQDHVEGVMARYEAVDNANGANG